MKIGHLIATNYFGGPEKQIIEHAKRISGKRFEITIFSFIERDRPNELLAAAEKMSIPAKGFRTWNPFNPTIILELAFMLREERVDILCTHSYKANVIGRLATRITRIPEIAVSRGWTGENRKVRVFEELDRYFLKLADHVVAVSHKQKEKVLELGLVPDKVTVIHNGINIDDVRQHAGEAIRTELGLDDNCCLVMSAGRLSPEKNFSGLIGAAEMIRGSSDCDIRFAVFGEGPLRSRLEKNIRDAGLQKIFFLPGFRKDFLSLLGGADIFVLPSFSEGLPNVILEAYSLKKPVIATSVGGIPEVVQDGLAGLLVRPDETGKLADCITRLARDRALRKEMGIRGYEHLREHFNFDIQTKKFEELYVEVYDSFHHHSHAC